MSEINHPWRRATTPDQERMSDIDLFDELSRLSKIAAVIVCAIEGAEDFQNRREQGGILWIVNSFADDIAALENAFEEEIKMRSYDAKDRERAAA